MFGMFASIVWFSAKEIYSGSLLIGDMMAFINYAMLVVMSFLFLSMISVMLPRANVASKRIEEIIKTEPIINDTVEKIPCQARDDSPQDIIQFNNVSFCFEGGKENALSDISLKIKKGEFVSFLGGTGSGKSTLLSLIPRMFDASSGEVLFYGNNVKDIKQEDLRKDISFTSQKAEIFSGTIRKNIVLGSENISDEKLFEYLEIAKAEEFVTKEKGGLDAIVSEGGQNFSGGQKQRLSIARGIAKNADIYIFDDCFSALDYKTEKEITAKIFEMLKGKTVIVSSQRIATVMNSDEIYILSEGKIIASGNHEELVSKNEFYNHMAKAQLGEANGKR
jgi:ATP-binding cassette subfamily B protein